MGGIGGGGGGGGVLLGVLTEGALPGVGFSVQSVISFPAVSASEVSQLGPWPEAGIEALQAVMAALDKDSQKTEAVDQQAECRTGCVPGWAVRPYNSPQISTP